MLKYDKIGALTLANIYAFCIAKIIHTAFFTLPLLGRGMWHRLGLVFRLHTVNVDD